MTATKPLIDINQISKQLTVLTKNHVNLEIKHQLNRLIKLRGSFTNKYMIGSNP